MKIAFLIICYCVSIVSHCQISEHDTCRIKPTQSAYFNGLIKGDTVSVDELINAGPILSSNTNAKIGSFVYVIDCESCDFVTGKVFSNMFAEIDIKKIRMMQNKKAIIFFECIISRQNGSVFTHKDFYFFIK